MKQINKIAILGLGNVGLPLAKLFASKYPVIGFDINKTRMAELNRAQNTCSSTERIFGAKNDTERGLFLTSDLNDLKDCNIFVITVPTPVDKTNNPDLSPLIQASK